MSAVAFSQGRVVVVHGGSTLGRTGPGGARAAGPGRGRGVTTTTTTFGSSTPLVTVGRDAVAVVAVVYRRPQARKQRSVRARAAAESVDAITAAAASLEHLPSAAAVAAAAAAHLPKGVWFEGEAILSAFRPALDSTLDGFSIVAPVVAAAQRLMGLDSTGLPLDQLPTGGASRGLSSRIIFFSSIASRHNGGLSRSSHPSSTQFPYLICHPSQLWHVPETTQVITASRRCSQLS